jgi:hypothetical protein
VDQNKNKGWKELCKQAENEKDPAKLLALVQEIDRLLEAQGEWRTRGRIQMDEAGSSGDGNG